jgi:CDP-diacylglycerol--glycerol-3-phosphate 3-phosphatidyltransferase
VHRLLAPPNLVSLARLPLAAAFLLTAHRDVRLALIAGAAATDFLDGWLARRGHTTRLGAVLDPVTDKAFVVTAILSLAINGPLTTPELLVMLSRDIAVGIGLAIVLLRHARMQLSARMPGKVATVAQLAGLVALVAAPAWKLPIIALVGVASAIAIADYGREAIRALRTPRRAH